MNNLNYLLIISLSEITEELKKYKFFNNINYGGCGHFVHIIINELKKLNTIFKNFNLKYKIKVALECGINHVFLEFPKLSFWYDSDGITKHTDRFLTYGYALGTITFNKLKNLNLADDWNKSFNRNNIPIIQEIVSNTFQRNFYISLQ